MSKSSCEDVLLTRGLHDVQVWPATKAGAATAKTAAVRVLENIIREA